MNSKALKAITVATLSISMVSGCATTAPSQVFKDGKLSVPAALGIDTRAPEQKAFAELTHSVCTKAKSDPRYINQCANLMNVQRSNELNVNVR